MDNLAAFGLQESFDLLHLPIDLTSSHGIGQIITYGFALACVLGFAARHWRKAVREGILHYSRRWRSVLGGFLVSSAMTVVIGILWCALMLHWGAADWSWSATHQTWQRTWELANQGFPVWLSFAVAVVLVATEEVLFRGFIFNYLRGPGGRLALLVADILSSTVFALSHHFDEPMAWLRREELGLLIGLGLLGCMLALVYHVTDSLACSTEVHAGLVWLTIFLKKSKVVIIQQPGWGLSDSLLPQTAPSVWILFILLTVVFCSIGGAMRARFAIEGRRAQATSPREREPGILPALARRWLLALVGSAACIAGLSIALRLTEMHRSIAARAAQVALERLEAAVRDGADIADAARTAGFRPSVFVQGLVDVIYRCPDGEIRFLGSAADSRGDAAPLTITVFAGKAAILEVQTRGESDDVARYAQLARGAARNVHFGAIIACDPGARLVAIATTNAKTYALLRPENLTCPGPAAPPA